jgi:hypothetical protein
MAEDAGRRTQADAAATTRILRARMRKLPLALGD